MNLPRKLVKPKMRLNSVTSVGSGMFLSASTFLGSGEIPSLLILCPRNSISVHLNSHFSGFSFRLTDSSFSSTLFKCISCISPAIGTMAIGISTRSTELMTFAIEHNTVTCAVRVSLILELIVYTISQACPFKTSK